MKASPKEPWYHSATLYQIYPLSFADSNGDGFGDLRGIIDHLDYLNDGTAKSLGVRAIWLSPVYLSPMADWGYDVADHKAIDPRFGTMKDFEELLRQVHKRGMRLLMDYVPNHTSNLHNWFLESRSSRDNPKRDWYIWADPAKDGGPPNNWLSHFAGPAWELDEVTGQYYLHSYFSEQPDLNWRNPKVREAMQDVLRFWLNKGVDGFRCDAAYGLLKDLQLKDDLPNPNYLAGVSNPADEFLRVHSAGQKELNSIINSFCDALAKKKNTFLLSEVDINVPALHKLYGACKKHPLHAPFNFNLMSLTWGASSYRNFIDQYEDSMGPDDWPNYVLGNHDRRRLASRVGAERARLLAMLQLTLRGLPVVYQGDELGMVDGVLRHEQVRDRWELRVPGQNLGRDAERTPMQWDEDNGAGFTDGIPWLPPAPHSHQLNVEVEERHPDSSLNLYRHLIHLRNSAPALRAGTYRSLNMGNPYVYAYLRETELQRFLVLLNFDKNPADVLLKGPAGNWVAGTHEVDGDGRPPEGSVVNLRGYEGRVYELVSVKEGETMKLVFDVGATHMRLALADGDELVQIKRLPTEPKEGGFDRLLDAMKELAGDSEIEAAAGCLPGQFDLEGNLKFAHNLPGWRGLPVKERIKETLGCPVHLENDVVLGGLGEAHAGAGATEGIMAYVTVSTGVNAVRIAEGVVDKTIKQFELGKQLVRNSQGHLETLEELIGGAALEARKGLTAAGPHDGRTMRSEERHLAVSLYNMILYWTPDLIVLGGGMVEHLDLDAVEDELAQMPRVLDENPKIARANLGDAGGLHGALVLLNSRADLDVDFF